jgi:hypothetical protein
MTDERRFTIRRVDGMEMGEYAWYATDSLDGWEWAEVDSDDTWDEGPTEYITEEWVRVNHKTRAFIGGRDAAEVLAERAEEDVEA